MRIAVVEDEKKLAETLQVGLVNEGFTVTLFPSGVSAEETLTKSNDAYDVIILDLGLPDQDGFEVCRKVRAAGVQIPILILTARDTIDDRVALLDVGADDFMSKPFDFTELLARIRALLRRPRHSLPEDLAIGDLRLSPKRREVTRAGHMITLTPKEFDILHHLMRNAGRAVSRDELAQRFWGDEGRLTSNVLDAHIKNLRDKIDNAYVHKYLQTVRGVGFTLQEPVG